MEVTRMAAILLHQGFPGGGHFNHPTAPQSGNVWRQFLLSQWGWGMYYQNLACESQNAQSAIIQENLCWTVSYSGARTASS